MNLGKILYGGDYNPEQWMFTPGIWDEDIRLMNLARINEATVGIFSWVSLEPEEGRYDFTWLDEIFEKLTAAGKSVILATPSGAKPAWLAAKYPEIRRVTREGRREPQGGRHNHCPTSPVYRAKVQDINRRLSERYGSRENVVLWHLSNEYGGYCWCDLCYAAFREWLKQRYGTLDALNAAWWTRFWSHSYTDWDQIDWIDDGVHGMALDWRRFMTDQCVDFMKHEIAAVRSASPKAKFTTNMMGFFYDLNYWKFAPHLDVISYDAYPFWHSEAHDWDVSAQMAVIYDFNRALGGGKPWLLMETTPSSVQWYTVSRPRRPGMNRLSGLQTVAQGSDGVMYFQWRKSRGSCEKFHGAVVDHAGHENTRVFREVAQLGADLEKLVDVVGSTTRADVALIYDWENRWAIDSAQHARNADKQYGETVSSFHLPLYRRGIAVDVIESVCDFTGYKLLIAPMLYMTRPGVAERVEAFVAAGGTFVATYLTGSVDESDLCHLGGFPGPLRKVLGVWAEETDVLWDHDHQTVHITAGGEQELAGEYKARHYCDIVHLEGAASLAAYGQDFYAGSPALTVNHFGSGKAYYIASRNEDRFQDDFLASLIRALSLKTAVDVALPHGVAAHKRVGENGEFVFLLNFNTDAVQMDMPARWQPGLDGVVTGGKLSVPGYGVAVLRHR